MGRKHARSQILFDAARQEDLNARKEEEVILREQAYHNIFSSIGGDRELAYGATPYQQSQQGPPQIGGSEPAGVFTGEQEATGRRRWDRYKGWVTQTQEGVDPGSIFKRREASEAAKHKVRAARYGDPDNLDLTAGFELDPKKLTEQVKGTAQFRIMNKLMVEAEDFMNREGPLYDKAVRSSIGPIMEGSARSHEQAMQQIKQMNSRGGSARRNAMSDAMAIQASIQNNAQLVSQLSDAHFRLDTWARDNAAATVQRADAWAKNVAGIRQEYAASMEAFTNYMGQVGLPKVSEQMSAYQSMSEHLGDNKTNWGGIALGVAGLVAAPFTGGASLALTAGAAGSI